MVPDDSGGIEIQRRSGLPYVFYGFNNMVVELQ